MTPTGTHFSYYHQIGHLMIGTKESRRIYNILTFYNHA